MAGCACPDRHLDPLGGAAELSFPWAGLLVLPTDYETMVELTTSLVPYRYGGPNQQFQHGILHFVQALGSPFLHRHGLRLLRMAEEVVGGADPAELRAELAVTRRPNASGLTAGDLLESAAELESARMTYATLAGTLPAGSPAALYRSQLHHAYPDPAEPRRKAFDHFAGVAGLDAAYELLALVTFLVFLGDDPAGMFDQLAPAVAKQAEGVAGLSAAQLLDRLGWADNYEEYLDLIVAGEPIGTPFLVDPLRAALALHGRSALIETLARPATGLLALGEDELRAIEPPLIVYPSRDGGLVHHRNGLARGDDSRFAYRIIAAAGTYGAAERMTSPVTGGDAYCAHVACPQHAGALCHRWFLPPDSAEGHEACSFPSLVLGARS
ncbi:hypothetical protein ACQP2F_22935 [Actinoplanes sp. CA-030573]|uniref:hypothetical protein n=1 Tax=Actinoplanes sp. CA-030573 TaxID=3239898 RepID=UPI003D9028FA